MLGPNNVIRPHNISHAIKRQRRVCWHRWSVAKAALLQEKTVNSERQHVPVNFVNILRERPAAQKAPPTNLMEQ